MKSAYELAMERLRESDPDPQPLSDSQKKQLAEIENKFKARKAEREIFLKKQLDHARRQGQFEELQKIERQINDEKDRHEREMEAEKDKVRSSHP